KSFELQSPPASRLECAGAEVMREAQDPQACAQGLLRMHSTLALLTKQRCGGRPDGLGALQKPLVAELDEGTVAFGPMSGLGDEPAGLRSPEVARNGLTAVIDLDGVGSDPKIHALADQTVRNRVVMALVLDVIVEEHLGALPGGVLV